MQEKVKTKQILRKTVQRDVPPGTYQPNGKHFLTLNCFLDGKGFQTEEKNFPAGTPFPPWKHFPAAAWKHFSGGKCSPNIKKWEVFRSMEEFPSYYNQSINLLNLTPMKLLCTIVIQLLIVCKNFLWSRIYITKIFVFSFINKYWTLIQVENQTIKICYWFLQSISFRIELHFNYKNEYKCRYFRID